MEKVMFKRRFTEEQRVKYVNEVLESGSNVLIAKKYDIRGFNTRVGVRWFLSPYMIRHLKKGFNTRVGVRWF